MGKSNKQTREYTMKFESINAFYICNYDVTIKGAKGLGFDSTGVESRSLLFPIQILDQIILEDEMLRFRYLDDKETYVAELTSSDDLAYKGRVSLGDYSFDLELTHFKVNEDSGFHLFFGKWVEGDRSQEFVVKCRKVDE